MTGLRERAARAWDRFWFAHGSARNLAVARILVAAQALWILLSRDYPGIAGLPREFWADVPLGIQWRFLLFHGHQGLETALYWSAALALACAMLGVWSRFSCLAAAVLLYHLAPLEAVIWQPTVYARGLTVPVLALAVLSLGRCDDALALPRRARRTPPTSPELDYSWQLRLAQLFVCQMYLFSAFAKLDRVGLSWVSADNIRRWILTMVQNPETNVYQAPGLWVAEQPALCLAIAATALALELTFVLVLFRPTVRRWMVPTALLFHVGIYFTMNLFVATAALLPIFVDWDQLADRLRRRGRPLASAP